MAESEFMDVLNRHEAKLDALNEKLARAIRILEQSEKQQAKEKNDAGIRKVLKDNGINLP